MRRESTRKGWEKKKCKKQKKKRNVTNTIEALFFFWGGGVRWPCTTEWMTTPMHPAQFFYPFIPLQYIARFVNWTPDVIPDTVLTYPFDPSSQHIVLSQWLGDLPWTEERHCITTCSKEQWNFHKRKGAIDNLCKSSDRGDGFIDYVTSQEEQSLLAERWVDLGTRRRKYPLAHFCSHGILIIGRASIGR